MQERDMDIHITRVSIGVKIVKIAVYLRTIVRILNFNVILSAWVECGLLCSDLQLADLAAVMLFRHDFVF